MKWFDDNGNSILGISVVITGCILLYDMPTNEFVGIVLLILGNIIWWNDH